MLSAADEACFSAAAAAVPLLASLSREQLSVARLGGLTNIVFRVEACVAGGLQRYCLRCPGPGTESYIDRAAERANAEAASRAGVGPAVLSFSDEGVLLMPLLPGETMSPEAFRSRPGAAARAGVALRTLHHSGEAFASRFELFEQASPKLRRGLSRGTAAGGSAVRSVSRSTSTSASSATAQRCPKGTARRSRTRRPCARRYLPGRSPSRRATATRSARTLSTTRRGAGGEGESRAEGDPRDAPVPRSL